MGNKPCDHAWVIHTARARLSSPPPPAQVSARPGQDNLAMSALRFLSTVSRSVHASLFAAPGVLRQVCESIVLPNLRVSGAHACVCAWRRCTALHAALSSFPLSSQRYPIYSPTHPPPSHAHTKMHTHTHRCAALLFSSL